MASPIPAKPRIKKWRGKHYIFFFEPKTQRHVRKSCEVLEATTAEQRKELLEEYSRLFKLATYEAFEEQLGLRQPTRYDADLVGAIARYRADVVARKEEREANPEARVGISETTADLNLYTIDRFSSWLAQNYGGVTTGNLSPTHLREFFRLLSTEKVKRGKESVIVRSAATLNKHRRVIGACLSWLDEQRPRLFPDFADFRKALKPQHAEAPEPVAFSPDQLAAFYRAARDPVEVVEVRRIRFGKVETFRQSVSGRTSKPHTPPHILFLLLALTGCRLGEALALKWEDVDLERGRITYRAKKTGRRRIVPLIGDSAGDVSPELLKLLKHWKLEAGRRPYVLPGRTTKKNPEGAPRYWRANWERIVKAAGVDSLHPQTLRQNFTSFAAAMGVPAATCALWQGHRVEVAERHYRAQALDAIRGADSLEEAMGLSAAVRTELRRKSEARRA